MAEETTFIFSGSSGSLEGISIDAFITEQHGHSLRVTDHPVETGAAISDHARIEPDRLVLECVITDSPSGGDFKSGRSADIYERLRLLQDNATLCTIATSLRVYENMILESISAPRTAREAGGLKFTLTTKQVVLVQNKTTLVTVTKEPITKKKVSTGKQPAKQLSEAEAKAAVDELEAKANNSSGLRNLIGPSKRITPE